MRFLNNLCRGAIYCAQGSITQKNGRHKWRPYIALVLLAVLISCGDAEKKQGEKNNPESQNEQSASESSDPSGAPSPVSDDPKADPSEPKTYDPDNYTSVGLDPYNPCDEGPCEEDIDDVNEPPLEGGTTSI